MNIKSVSCIDDSLLDMTYEWARRRSKDPSTKVGACIYDAKTGGMFFGYNGFPSQLGDSEDVWNNRDPSVGFTKYEFVVHAEKNALYKALRAGVSLETCTLYCTHIPCPRCMIEVVASNNIKRVVYRIPTFMSLTDRDLELIWHVSRTCNIVMDIK